MPSVSQICSRIHQPEGGLIPPSAFRKENVSSNFHWNDCCNFSKQNINAISKMANSFFVNHQLVIEPEIAIKITESVQQNKISRYEFLALTKEIHQTFIQQQYSQSIQKIIQLHQLGEDDVIKPNNATMMNIERLVQWRSNDFVAKYGKAILNYITFKNGWTPTVNCGGIELLTADTLWKEIDGEVTAVQTLKLTTNYLVGLRSEYNALFNKIHYLGFFDPCNNCVFRLAIKNIDPKVLEQITTEILQVPKYKS